jgi:transposase-like protein
MGRRSKFNDSVRSKMRERYSSGETLTEIADSYGCCPATIWRIVSKVSRSGPRRRSRFAERNFAMFQARKDGQSLTSIAREHGITKQRVWEICQIVSRHVNDEKTETSA